MQRKRATYKAHAQSDAEGPPTSTQTVIDFDASDQELTQENIDPLAVAEPPPSEYTIKTGWVDTAKRTRTWVLCEPSGEKVAEITTLRDARKLADILNRVMGDSRSRSR